MSTQSTAMMADQSMVCDHEEKITSARVKRQDTLGQKVGKFIFLSFSIIVGSGTIFALGLLAFQKFTAG